jgi:3-dehydroquinate synthase
MNDLEITLQDYQIVLSDDLHGLAQWLRSAAYSQYYVLADDNTQRYCWPLLQEACADIALQLITIPEGEDHKNLATCEIIWSKLLDLQADRTSLIINLGGGVVGDMGGFAASTFKRGIDFIQVPTTVLSQVDASIGGKLGVDFKYGKNLIGLFRNPRRVHLSASFHRTLSDRQYLNGFAEIFKHAIIGSGELWDRYRNTANLRELDQLALLKDALLIKKEIVDLDPFEHGMRKALNFGHTIGHALEAWSIEHSKDPMLHGEAIAAGMLMESFLSVEKSGLPGTILQEIIAVLTRHYPLRTIPAGIEPLLWQYMQYDKKNEKGHVLAVLIENIGKPRWNMRLHRKDLNEAVSFYKNLQS